MDGSTQSTLRQRPGVGSTKQEQNLKSSSPGSGSDESTKTATPPKVKNEKKAYGKTPNGTLFEIPETHDVLSGLFDPRLPKSHIDLVTLFTLGSQVILFFILPTYISRFFYLGIYACFRISYNFGLGWILRQQSESRWLVKLVIRNGFMDEKRRPAMAAWCKSQLGAKMGKDYDFDKYPIEFNIWVLFRHMVDIILLNDFVAYSLFAFSWLQFPPGHSVLFHVMRWVVGWTLIVFNIWVKTDAHRIVTDLAWYWADCFFLSLQDLVFDGVFEMAPHPMYSIGYAGYYGLTLVVGSNVVFFVSLAAHACQFFFLVWFENPHIERTYITKQPIAARVPLKKQESTGSSSLRKSVDSSSSSSSNTKQRGRQSSVSTNASFGPVSDFHSEDPVSSATSVEATSEDEQNNDRERNTRVNLTMSGQVTTSTTNSSSNSSTNGDQSISQQQQQVMTRHDLNNQFFRSDLVIAANFDPFRAKDLFALVLGLYNILVAFLPWQFSVLNAMAWRAFHSFGLGLILKAQSENKWFVRHYLKHYHYGDSSQGANEEAFRNWKSFYNTSLCNTYISFVVLTWKFYSVSEDWTIGSEFLRHTFGILLILLHVWIARETFEVLGIFGWFYGDFFIEEYPKELYYTGIYRFLNNPERIVGGASFFGMAVLSGSKAVAFLALLSLLGHLWFLNEVENPHMKKLYGNAIRKEAGITKTLKNVASKNVHRAPTELQRVYKEIQGTFEKVSTEAVDALQEFLDKSGPLVSNAVHDTRILLQESRERLILTRVARDLSNFDITKYKLTIQPDSTYIDLSGNNDDSGDDTQPRFHWGDHIAVQWNAPPNHSRRDWIGIYRYGANKSKDITKVSSKGKWWGIMWDQWEGDQYVEKTQEEAIASVNKTNGKITFSGNKIPSETGVFEMRYHHDGKHNVMAVSGPFTLYVAKPNDPQSLEDTRDTLLNIVGRCLEQDPKMVPVAYLKNKDDISLDGDAVANKINDYDFVLYTPEQAQQIALAIKEAFGIELVSDVVVADANVATLAERIIQARRLLQPFAPISP